MQRYEKSTKQSTSWHIFYTLFNEIKSTAHIVKQAWIILDCYKLFVCTKLIDYLCEKIMDKKAIEEIMANDALLERFMEILVDEINNDEEAYYKKGRQLLDLCLSDENADDFFIAICGWSVDSLLEKL